MSRFFFSKNRLSYYSCASVVLLLLLVVPKAALAASIADSINQVLWAFVSSVFGFFVWLAGMALDYSISKFIVEFGELFRTSGLGAAVNNLWMVIRDIFNLFFIFGLIYAGFNMIINSDEGGARKAIVNLIIAALLINFSLFITKTIIDFGNIAAVQVAKVLYESAGGANGSISGAFLSQMGATGLWSPRGANPTPQTPGLIYIIGSMILLMIAAFTFAVGAVLIGIRFIALNYYMIISPVMFLNKIVPKFGSHTSKFWEGLWKNVFFAPAFLLLLYFSLFILGSMNTYIIGPQGGGRAQLYDAFQAGQDPQTSVTTIVMFLMAAGFLIAAVTLAQKMSVIGGSMAVSIGTDMKKRGLGILSGAGRGVGRGIGGYGARWINRRAEGLSSSLDTKLGGLGQSRFKAVRAVARGVDNTVGDGLRSAQKISVLGSETASTRDKRIKEHQGRFNKSAQVGERATGFAEQTSIIAENYDVNDPTQRAKRAEALGKLAGIVKRMSDDEVLKLNQSTLTDPEFAQLLTDAHITALKNSGKYTNSQTTAIGKARDAGTFDTISQALKSTNTDVTELNSALEQLTQTVQRISGDRLTGLDHKILSSQRVAMNLTDKQIDELRTSGKFNAQQMTAIENARTAAFTAVAAGAAPDLIDSSNPKGATVISSIRAGLFQKSAQEAGRLPAAVFSSRNMQSFITPTALQQRVRNGLSQAEINEIERNIQEYLNTLPANANQRNMWTRWAANTTEGSRFNFV